MPEVERPEHVLLVGPPEGRAVLASVLSQLKVVHPKAHEVLLDAFQELKTLRLTVQELDAQLALCRARRKADVRRVLDLEGEVTRLSGALRYHTQRIGSR